MGTTRTDSREVLHSANDPEHGQQVAVCCGYCDNKKTHELPVCSPGRCVTPAHLLALPLRASKTWSRTSLPWALAIPL